jgi:hypothetical protein
MKLVLVGNCQVQKLAFFLPLVNPNINVAYIKQVHLPDASENDPDVFLTAVKNSDFVVSHQISNSYHKEYLTSSFLSNTFGSKFKLMTNFWFNGYDPSYFVLKNSSGMHVNGPLGPGCFYHIIEGYLKNYSVDQIYKNWTDMKGIENKVISTTNKSIYELIERDKDVDIKCAQWVESNFRSTYITHTVNHPNISFLIYQASCISEYFCSTNSKTFEASIFPDDYQLNFYSIPINPFIYSHFNIKTKLCDLFRGYFLDDLYNNRGISILNRKQFIEAYIDFLNSIGSGDHHFLEQQLEDLIKSN